MPRLHDIQSQSSIWLVPAGPERTLKSRTVIVFWFPQSVWKFTKIDQKTLCESKSDCRIWIMRQFFVIYTSAIGTTGSKAGNERTYRRSIRGSLSRRCLDGIWHFKLESQGGVTISSSRSEKVGMLRNESNGLSHHGAPTIFTGKIRSRLVPSDDSLNVYT